VACRPLRGHGGGEDFRDVRLVSERAVRAHGVEVASPAFDDDLGFYEGIEDLTVEKLVAEPGIERQDEAAFPRATGCDVGRLGASRADPFLNRLSDEFRLVI